MPNKLPTLNLPSANDLFTTQEERDDLQRERVIDLPLSEISDFPKHPFRVKMDADMMEMVESIKCYGVLVPGLVRHKENGGYEMVAGHRRKKASELAERDTMPCIIRELTDDEATIIMVDSNLQRERILPSEKAFAYKMKLDAMKRQQGERVDLTSAPTGQMFDGKTSREVLAENSPDSHSQIQRYIRLTELAPPMLDMVDSNQLALRSAVELSYIPQEQQETLRDAFDAESSIPSHVQAVKLRKLSEDGRLTNDNITSIMKEIKPVKVEHFKLPREKIQHFFPANTPSQAIEETIINALELWHSNQQKPHPR
ncbi:MAG: ParB/RepB/Spo0J family partition protein [Defluviitaleaceae bacterium]|nr:ParB/RepB/Spo0J family partition protein [Defluviitaleaceae bacterium]